MLEIDERTLRTLSQIATWARDCTPGTLYDAFGDVSLVLADAERALSALRKSDDSTIPIDISQSSSNMRLHV